MTITKTTEITSISADMNGTVCVRYSTNYEENGVACEGSPVITGEYIYPGDDFSDKDPSVAAVCNLIHTPEKIELWRNDPRRELTNKG